jgi:hypothetical protein
MNNIIGSNIILQTACNIFIVHKIENLNKHYN